MSVSTVLCGVFRCGESLLPQKAWQAISMLLPDGPAAQSCPGSLWDAITHALIGSILGPWQWPGCSAFPLWLTFSWPSWTLHMDPLWEEWFFLMLFGYRPSYLTFLRNVLTVLTWAHAGWPRRPLTLYPSHVCVIISPLVGNFCQNSVCLPSVSPVLCSGAELDPVEGHVSLNAIH